jgi:hypothetical protein
MRQTPFMLAAVLALVAAPTIAGIVDTPVPLLLGEKATHAYSVPGVLNIPNLATFFSCTSTASAPIRVAAEVFADGGGAPLNNASLTSVLVPPGGTTLLGTSAAAGLFVELNINIAPFGHGSARILSTSKSIICTAFVADKANNPPSVMNHLTIVAKAKQKAAN